MSTPVFLLVLGQGFKEAWYQLSKQEQDDLWAQVEEVDRQAGAVWRILCDSRWADESIFDWGVIEYPDFDSYRHEFSAGACSHHHHAGHPVVWRRPRSARTTP